MKAISNRRDAEAQRVGQNPESKLGALNELYWQQERMQWVSFWLGFLVALVVLALGLAMWLIAVAVSAEAGMSLVPRPSSLAPHFPEHRAGME